MERLEQLKNNNYVMTNTIKAEIEHNGSFTIEIMNGLKRHLTNDFGDLCQDDKDMNLKALKDDLKYDRVLSKYHTTQGDIYIITELYDIDSDMYVTTVMFTDEY